MQETARVAIIGGGVVGCSLVYYLAEAGCSDALLIESHELASGTTWGSSALVTHLASSPFLARSCQERGTPRFQHWRNSTYASALQPIMPGLFPMTDVGARPSARLLPTAVKRSGP